MTNNSIDLGTVDFSKMSPLEVLEWSQNAAAMVKADAEREQERVRGERRALYVQMGENIVGTVEQTETALWSGFKPRGEVVEIFGEAYNVNVTLTHVKRKAQLVADDAAKKAASADAAALEVVADDAADDAA